MRSQNDVRIGHCAFSLRKIVLCIEVTTFTQFTVIQSGAMYSGYPVFFVPSWSYHNVPYLRQVPSHLTVTKVSIDVHLVVKPIPIPFTIHLPLCQFMNDREITLVAKTERISALEYAFCIVLH
ncbi:unnamed protein product [Albugo candida]|uniref:Uncharacterized protein n=1 Tax=Albugo candida TaxID=65357 RepID=A0A024GC97_9STRA|nr:unnamed protein product [Albugo candida]|eukprot:CCI44175.1 unnamed protein product [Albugo candida]